MIAGSQIQAARKLVGWWPSRLAERAGVSTTMVRRAEQDEGGTLVTVATLRKIESALSAAGVAFTGGGDPRLKTHADGQTAA